MKRNNYFLILLTLFSAIILMINPPAVYASGSQDSSKTSVTSDTPGLSVPTVKLVFFEGDVEINGKGAELGDEFKNKITVRTGENSYCDLVFAEKNAIRITQNSFASLDFTSPLLQVDMQRGNITAVLRKLASLDGQDRFRIKTPSAVAGVRGTSLCVWTDGTETYICTCNGTVHSVDFSGTFSFTTTAAHHSAKRFIKQGNSILVQDAGLEKHTDESVQAVANIIGEVIDWDHVK